MNRSFAFAAAFVAAAAGAASATTRSSFMAVEAITDVTAVPSNVGLTYAVSVGSNPTFTVNDTIYTITDVFGFYALSDDDDLVASVSNFSANGGEWKKDSSNSGTGGIAGWKTNPNTGMTPGESVTFNFNSLGVENVERLGFHVRVAGIFPGTSGNTGNITLVPTDRPPVPAAPTVLGLAGCGLIVVRRRRN